MHDILAVCDRATVLYEGKKAADLDCSTTTVEEIVNYIVTDPDAGRMPSSIDVTTQSDLGGDEPV